MEIYSLTPKTKNKTNLFLHHSPLTKREATKTALPKVFHMLLS